MTEPAPQAKGRGRPPKERRNKLFTRETLLHAGMEVVTEKGFSAVGVDEILQRTGISRCSFYYYFKSKEGFGAELIDLYRDGILQELENCLADESLPPLNRLRAFVGQRRRAIMESGYRCGCLIPCLSPSASGSWSRSTSGNRPSPVACGLRRRPGKWHLRETVRKRPPSSGTDGKGPSNAPIWNGRPGPLIFLRTGSFPA